MLLEYTTSGSGDVYLSVKGARGNTVSPYPKILTRPLTDAGTHALQRTVLNMPVKRNDIPTKYEGPREAGFGHDTVAI